MKIIINVGTITFLFKNILKIMRDIVANLRDLQKAALAKPEARKHIL